MDIARRVSICSRRPGPNRAEPDWVPSRRVSQCVVCLGGGREKERECDLLGLRALPCGHRRTRDGGRTLAATTQNGSSTIVLIALKEYNVLSPSVIGKFHIRAQACFRIVCCCSPSEEVFWTFSKKTISEFRRRPVTEVWCADTALQSPLPEEFPIVKIRCKITIMQTVEYYDNEKRKRNIYCHWPPFVGTSDLIFSIKCPSSPFYFIRTSIKYSTWESRDYACAAFFSGTHGLAALINARFARLQQNN